ncbi:FAD-binding protein [Lentzea tibetensis]|uniref:FAD-binding protein n=1 Tax=Lentzea tibetensis TaxID=2591470 RepID=A0A563ERN3_9PSEU|nr:cholesterol oxidase substrate-binding domain-containing protein [Lentzea tibetensis]TWP49521.1 FAD-binding protein [Lentzea tibetensis]
MVSRRQFLAAPAAVWLARGAITPPDFPEHVEIRPEAYANWDGTITTGPLWTCVPRTTTDVVTVVNWAHRHSYTVRAQGLRRGWSPLTVAPGQRGDVLLVDTTQHLTAMSVSGDQVRVQAGATMESLLEHLAGHGLGLTAAPSPGSLTVGGVLAVNGHGSAIPARGERVAAGHTFGSLANAVLALTAVVWDGAKYAERTFRRDEADCAAFLTHLGRAFVTEVTLRAGPDQNLHCRSHLDVPAAELFSATPGPRSYSTLLDRAGRVGVIWFAFTDKPWVQVWEVSPTRPALSRPTQGPYNYPFTDNLPPDVADLAKRIVQGKPDLAPAYGNVQRLAIGAGLTATAAWDLWGPSRHVMLFVKPTTARITSSSCAVLTPRAKLQDVVHRFTTFYANLLESYRARGLYPINGAVEIRVSGLDDPADTGVPGAVAPALSPVRPHPGCDVAVWLDVITFPGTPGAHEFYRDLEDFAHATWPGRVRAEWSKRWGHTSRGPWTDLRRIPAAYPDWDGAVRTLHRYDPHRVFTSPLLDELLE